MSRRWSLIRFCFFSSSQVRVERRRERKKGIIGQHYSPPLQRRNKKEEQARIFPFFGFYFPHFFGISMPNFKILPFFSTKQHSLSLLLLSLKYFYWFSSLLFPHLPTNAETNKQLPKSQMKSQVFPTKRNWWHQASKYSFWRYTFFCLLPPPPAPPPPPI